MFKVTSRLNSRVRKNIVFILLVLMSTQFFLYTSWEKYKIDFTFTELFIINIFLLCLIILFSVEAPLKKIKWNVLLTIPWFACFILIILSGMHHNISGALMMYAFIMIFIFPALFFVWNNRGDYDVLYRLVCKAIVIVLIPFFVFHLLFMPIIEPLLAYQGIAVNPNSIGLIGVAGVISSLYLIILEKRKKWLYIISYGISFTLIYLSLSRASFISFFLVTIVFIIIYIRSRDDRDEKLSNSISIIAILIICLLVSIVLYKNILIEVTPEIRENTDRLIATKVYAEETDDNALIEKFNRGNNINEFSSGRIIIWKSYIEEMNFIGNERGNIGLYIEERAAAIPAHNSYLEIAYRSGIVPGLLYAFIAIYAAVYAFRFIFGKKLFNYKLSMIPMAVIAFGILSNLERALYPVEKAHIFLFFIAMAPMFVKEIKTISDEQK